MLATGMTTGVAVLVAVLALGGDARALGSRPARCQLLHAILGVPHSGARSAFRDLECVRARTDRHRLLVRATITDEDGTRVVLAPGERCLPQGYLGADVRRLSRSRRPQSLIELRLARRSADQLSFSVLLETWGSKRDAATTCGASGDGTVWFDGREWRVRS
jgi:hypothetical protein